MAAAYRAEGREIGTEPLLVFVTASLHVDYVRPTPLGVALEVRGRIEETKGRKAVVGVTTSAEGKVRARGEIVVLRVPRQSLGAPSALAEP